MPTLEGIVQQWHMAQPSPHAPSLTVGEYPVAVRLATILKFGSGHATPAEAANLWHEYQQLNQALVAQKKMPLGPEEFAHVTQQMARSSFAFHGRPPSMYEIQRLRDASPSEIHGYYGDLPDEHYPTLTAAEMAKALASARPWANQALGRDPLKLEAAYLAHSGQNPQAYYQQVGNDQAGGDPRAVGPAIAGGQPDGARAADSGLASGNAAAGGAEGVPAR